MKTSKCCDLIGREDRNSESDSKMAIMPDWNKGTILLFCLLLVPCFYVCFYVTANMPNFLLQDFFIRSLVVVICTLLGAVILSAIEMGYQRVTKFFKRMFHEILSSWPDSSTVKGSENRLIKVHSLAFGGRGMFVTAGVSTDCKYYLIRGLKFFI